MKPPDDLDFIPALQAAAFDPLEFLTTLHATGARARQTEVFTHQKEYEFALTTAYGKMERYRYSDVFEYRLGAAVVRHYHPDRSKFFSFMWRWFACIDLVRSEVLGGEFRQRASSENEPDIIHPSVVELASSFPLTSNGSFEPAAFLAELKRRNHPA